MNILRLVQEIFIRLFLIVSLLPLQSCSNTQIGEKLENSFDTTDNLITSDRTNEKPKKTIEKLQKTNKTTRIKSKTNDKSEENENDYLEIVKENTISKKDRLSQKSKKKTNFNPQPYRIILRLSGANPSAPAETVTEALRTAGVQFEVEKIERFDGGDLSNGRPMKR